jgi:hypothetical protein
MRRRDYVSNTGLGQQHDGMPVAFKNILDLVHPGQMFRSGVLEPRNSARLSTIETL